MPHAASFASLDQALKKEQAFDGVVVASPTRHHVEQALAVLAAGKPVLLEKPLSMDLASALRLQEAALRSPVPVLLGYTYRWWPPIRELKARLDRRAVGAVLHVSSVMSAHLADWHPWERYQDFFMASREQGGGALLDESHILDLIVWFFGRPSAVWADVARIGGLEIETDDNVDLWMRYADGKRVVIHLDLYGRPHDRSIMVRGTNGSLRWTYDPNGVQQSALAERRWDDTPFTCERNDMFLGVAREFVALVGGQGRPSCTVADGCAVMELVEAIRASAASGRCVDIEKESIRC